jgi:xanthine dehydrogenase accessory factor
MSEETCVLVCGIGETASAVAKRLFAEERAVAIHQAAPPRTLRRKMAFSDAWFDGAASLEGVEARRADLSSEFLLGLRARQFIPVLTQRFADVAERWPWDVIVAAHTEDDSPSEYVKSHADLTIGLGGDFIAGVDCDIVIETRGPDPGAILRSGRAPGRRQSMSDDSRADRYDVFAPSSGLFQATKIIGAFVEAGEALGTVGENAVHAPVSGRIRGVVRKGQAVATGSAIAEIVISNSTRVAGVSHRNQLISRGVAFAVEMEVGGWVPAPFEEWR